MVSQSRSRTLAIQLSLPEARRLRWVPFVVLLIGLLATAFTTWLLATVEAEKDRTRFASAVQQRHDAISERLITHIAMLRGVAGYMTANAHVERYEFKAYVDALGLPENYPGVLGIGYSQRISYESIDALQRLQRRQGYEGYRVWPDTPRDDYHAIVYLEPLGPRNRAAMGYDMSTEPVRASAMARARDTGEPSISGRVTLVQEIDDDKQAGFLIYVPVYSGLDEPATVEARRDRLEGFAYSPLRASDLLQSIIHSKANSLVGFAVYDGEARPENLLYSHLPNAADTRGAFVSFEQLPIAGRTWTIEYRALPAFDDVSGSGLVPVLLLCGLLVSFVIAGLSFMQARAQAAQRASARALEDYRLAVHREEKLYRLAVEQVSDYAIFLVSPAGAMDSWNEGVRKVLGWGEHEFLGQPIEVTFPDEEKKEAENELRTAREHQVATNDRWQVRKDGTRFWASGVTNTLYDEHGRFVGYLKVMRDLTESRLHQQEIEAHEQQLRLITDVLPVLISYVDAEQRYRFTNRTYETWFGKPRESLHGKTVRELVGDEAYARQRRRIESALAGEPVHYTIAIPIRGVMRDLSVTYSPDRTRDGRVVGFAAMVEDVTERKAAEERARTILESITDAFYAVDREWRFTYVNRLALEHFDQSPEALLGQSIWALFPDLRNTKMEALYRRAMSTQEPVSFQWHSVLSQSWIDIRAYPSTEGLSVYFRDITAQKRVEQERARQARTLAFLVELNQATAPLIDPDEINAVAAGLLGQLLHVNRCAYAEFDSNQQDFRITGDYADGVESSVGTYRLTDFGPDLAEALHAGRTYLHEDTASVLPPDNALRRLDIGAVICAPLIKNGRLVAAMAVHQVAPRKWTKEDVELVGLVASRCWEAIERARIARDLRENEERFRQMANSMPQLAWMARADGSVYWLNQRWYDYTGTTPSQMRNEGWRAAVHPNVLQSVLDGYYASVSSGQPFEMTYPLKGRDGRYREFLSRAVPVRDASGQVVQWFGTNTDVSSAREAEARFRAVVETTPEVVKIIGRDCAVQYINHAGLLRLGVESLDEVRGQSFVGFIAPQHRALWQANHERVCDGEQLVWQFEIVGLHGTRSWVETHAVPIAMADGGISHLGVTRDITAAKRIESEREQIIVAERAARAEAERVVRMKDEFLATLSHELRTPLSAVLGWAQLLRRRTMSHEDTAAALEAIERNAKAQQQLIEDLLDMSRIISGKVRLDVRPVRLPEVVDAALDVVRPMAEAKRIALVEEVDRATPPVNADPGRLQQVLWNLLTNAIKFTPSGGTVTVRLQPVGSALMLQVQDTGAGMAAEFLPQVFDRFRQFDSSTTRAHGGLGLGLSIVKSLVELHGGTVAAESAGEGAGATFTIILPVPAVAATQAHLPVKGGSAENGARAVQPDAPSLAGLKILVVDDEPDARVLVRRILVEYDAEVSVASNADEAMELLLRERPALILSDIGMPNVDGYALIRRIRELPPEQGGRTPAIALTAFAREDDRRRALIAGFQLHVAKPVDPVALVLACARMAEVAERQPAAETGKQRARKTNRRSEG